MSKSFKVFFVPAKSSFPTFQLSATKGKVLIFIIAILTNANKLYYFVFYLVNFLLGYSTIPCGFDIRP